MPDSGFFVRQIRAFMKKREKKNEKQEKKYPKMEEEIWKVGKRKRAQRESYG